MKLKEKYDLIFLDAAKGQNIKFFEKKYLTSIIFFARII